MSETENKIQVQQELFPWGEANPKRGLAHHETAVQFLEAFPVYTILDKEKFQQWTAMPVDGGGDSYEIRIGATRAKINNAASHPRMGESVFQIVPVGRGQFQVLPLKEVVSTSELPGHIARYVEGQIKKLNHLLQGIMFENLPEVQQYALQSYYDAIEAFKKRAIFETDTLEHDRLKVEAIFKLKAPDAVIALQD